MPHYTGSRLQQIQLRRTRVITARKQSLGQRNIFTGMCHFFSRGGGGSWLPSMHLRSHDQGGLSPMGGGLHAGGWADPPQDTWDTKG